MTDPLPADVREVFEDAARRNSFIDYLDVVGFLAKYPKKQLPSPARLHQHAETLRQIASEYYKPDHQSANWLRQIADDIDPNPEAAPPPPPPRRNPYKAAL